MATLTMNKLDLNGMNFFRPRKVPPNLLISFPNSGTKFLNTSSMSYVVDLSIDSIKGNKPSSTGMMNSNISRSNEIMENTSGIWSSSSKLFIRTLEVSQWINLWQSYQPVFQLATKIDFQYIVLFCSANYDQIQSDKLLNGLLRYMHKSWQDYDPSLYYSNHHESKDTIIYIYHGLLMNHELSSFFQQMFPLLGRDLSPNHSARPSGCKAAVDQILFHTRGIRTKTACCHTFWIYNDIIIICVICVDIFIIYRRLYMFFYLSRFVCIQTCIC